MHIQSPPPDKNLRLQAHLLIENLTAVQKLRSSCEDPIVWCTLSLVYTNPNEHMLVRVAFF